MQYWCELPVAHLDKKPNSAVKFPYERVLLFLLFAAPTTQRISPNLWQNLDTARRFINQVIWTVFKKIQDKER